MGSSPIFCSIHYLFVYNASVPQLVQDFTCNEAFLGVQVSPLALKIKRRLAQSGSAFENLFVSRCSSAWLERLPWAQEVSEVQILSPRPHMYHAYKVSRSRRKAALAFYAKIAQEVERRTENPCVFWHFGIF
jgi:hypothetical protein